jgi:hypothetical protein
MAQTDTRPGFRIPWTGDRTDADQPTPDAAVDPAAETDVETTDQPPAEEIVTADMIDTDPTAAARRPNKFMAELSRAMQGAAETARNETLTRFTTEAKTVVEEIHAASAEEAASLRRRADDDVAAVREWSKVEIARIREETDTRISARKAALDGEIEAHGKVVEARVERVGQTVAEYEAQMSAFFERLMTEEDPTRIATMAETLPDPPSLADVAASITEPPVVAFDPMPQMPEPAADPEPAAEGEFEAPAAPDFAAAEAEAATFAGELDEDDGQASATTETETQTEGETQGETEASAEAAPSSEGETYVEAEAPAVESHTTGERATTRVVVLGLVSVASIATFKRSLGRVPGVSAIGVASGPDGEFVFTVSHDSGLDLRGAITGLPGFEAQVTSETAEGLEVAAHDPDAAN